MIEAIIAGLVAGATYAILAVCLVVLYRLVGVVNFAQGALGALGAYTCYSAIDAGWPRPLAALAGVAVAILAAGIVGWLLARWFAGASPTVRLVLSVVTVIVVLTAGFRIFGDTPRVMPSLVPERFFHLGGVAVSSTSFIAVIVTVSIAGAFCIVRSRTRLGERLEAIAQAPVAVELLGVKTRVLTTLVWAASGAAAAIALVLVAPSRNPTFESMVFFVVPALAAALVAGFANVWVAVVAGLVLGALDAAGSRIGVLSDYRGAIPFVVVIVATIWLHRDEVWDAPR